MQVGGWGTGAMEGFASFMAEAAMKNAAKAKFGDTVKIGPVSKKCEVPTLLYECTARARLQIVAIRADWPLSYAALPEAAPALSRRAASAMSAVVPA